MLIDRKLILNHWDLQIPWYYIALSILCQLQLSFLNLIILQHRWWRWFHRNSWSLICFPAVHTTGEEKKRSPWPSHEHLYSSLSSMVSGDCSPNFKYPLYPCHLVTLTSFISSSKLFFCSFLTNFFAHWFSLVCILEHFFCFVLVLTV